MYNVQTNAEPEAIHCDGAGFIFNDFTSGPTAAQTNVLHTASCTWVTTMLGTCRP